MKLLAVFLVSGCLSFVGACADSATTKTGAVCPPNSTLTYTSFGKSFLDTYCVSCHSSSKTGAARNGAVLDVNYDSLSAAQAAAAAADLEAGSGPTATNESMPEGNPKPSVAERAKLSEWIACGAK